VNLWSEIDALNRRGKLALVGELLRQLRPTVQEIAHHAGRGETTVRGWMDTRGSPPSVKDQEAAAEPAQHGGRGPLHCADLLDSESSTGEKP